MFMAQIQSFFFKAMIEGWAKNSPKMSITDMPGYKAIPFEDGDFYLLDRYCVNPHSQRSTGTTTIWFRNEPVWVMNYGGYYTKGATAFLKNALGKAYQEHHFVGGRGPRVYKDGLAYLYINQARINEFEKFEGREEIFAGVDNVPLGFHEYWGMSLI